MRTYLTKLIAIDPFSGKLCEYSGPQIKGNGIQDAKYFCQENGLGYLEVIGESDSTINTETGQLYVDGQKILGLYLRWLPVALASLLFLILPSFSFSQDIESFIQVEEGQVVKAGLLDSMMLNQIPGDETVFLNRCKVHYDYISAQVLLADSTLANVFTREPDIYDGDTGYLEIFHGFGTKQIVEVRLIGIDTPERRPLKTRKEGLISRAYLIHLLESFPFLMAYVLPNNRFPESWKDDHYVRFLVVLYGVTSQGMLISINDKMVRDGFAKYENYKN